MLYNCAIRGSDLPPQEGLVRCFAQFRLKPWGQATVPYNWKLNCPQNSPTVNCRKYNIPKSILFLGESILWEANWNSGILVTINSCFAYDNRCDRPEWLLAGYWLVRWKKSKVRRHFERIATVMSHKFKMAACRLYAIVFLRTLSFKFCLIPKHLYALFVKKQRGKFSWKQNIQNSNSPENKTYKLKRSFIFQIL